MVDRQKSTLYCRGYRSAAHSAGKKEFIVETENKGTENQNLEEAPAAGESVISEEKAVAKFTALRHRAQAAELEAAELKGRLAGIQEVNAKAAPPAKSPLQLRAEQDGVAVDEVQMDGALYQAQRRHDDQVANQKAETKAKADKTAALKKSMDAAKANNADWQDVISAGEQHLTPGEMLDLENAGVDFGEQAYVKCKAAIERNKPKTETPAPDKKPGEPEEEAETPSRDEILADIGVDKQTESVMNL